MKSVSCERGDPRPESDDGAARKRATVETYARNEAALRRTARRFSLCEDDADDALQRGFEILLCKAPSADPRELLKWMQTVVKREAMALRHDRERMLVSPALANAAEEDWISLVPSAAAGPEERAERRETVARSREALQALKPQELRALTLLAEGYSYAEIGEITSWSHTKINRCLAEGRERFRRLVSRSEDGSRCAEMRSLISAFCDGEAGSEEAAVVREHLRVCAHCRATVRAYRAAPAAAAALAPVLPLHRSVLEQAHDAVHGLAGRFGGGKADAVAQVAGGGGAGGMGVTAVAKVAAICIGTAGGAAACVATGLVPSPLTPGATRSHPVRLDRHAKAPAHRAAVEYEPAPEPVVHSPESTKPKESKHDPAPEPEPAEAEPISESTSVAGESGAVEYAPPEPAPEPEPTAVESSSTGSPAGEFGP